MKGRTGIGDVESTENEWPKACNQRGRYWLYVVGDCAAPCPFPGYCGSTTLFGKLAVKATRGVRIDEAANFDVAEGGGTMSTAEATELTDILNRVTTWPTTLRITLARKILESLEKTEAPAVAPAPRTRGFSADEVQGVPRMDRPTADDQTIKLLGTIETHAANPPPRRRSLKDLQGVLKTDAPAPNDEECRSILEEELIKKHLK